MKDKPDEYWKQKLTPEQYRVLREKGTEQPFTGEFLSHNEDGTYACAACGQALFPSNAKFESGSGWPSFNDVVAQGNVELRLDTSHGMTRTEVVCSGCGGHLGHMWDNVAGTGTGQYFCINSSALCFMDGNDDLK